MKRSLVCKSLSFALSILGICFTMNAFGESEKRSRIQENDLLDVQEGSYWEWRSRHGLSDAKVDCHMNRRTGVSECTIDERDFDLLNERIRRLERAVRRLQMEVFDIADMKKVEEKLLVVCSIESNFKKTYVGKGTTEVEARAKAAQACEKAEGGVFCKSKPVCESEKRQ